MFPRFCFASSDPQILLPSSPQLALEWHPDKHTDNEDKRKEAEERFKLMGEVRRGGVVFQGGGFFCSLDLSGAGFGPEENR